MGQYRWKPAAKRLLLSWRLAGRKRIILGLDGNTRRRRIMIRTSAAATVAFIIVSVVKTLLRVERQGGDVWRRVGHYGSVVSGNDS